MKTKFNISILTGILLIGAFTLFASSNNGGLNLNTKLGSFYIPDTNTSSVVVETPVQQNEFMQQQQQQQDNSHMPVVQKSITGVNTSMHTNYIIYNSDSKDSSSTVSGYTPQDLYSLFNIPTGSKSIPNQNPNGIIAIIGVGNNPDAASDLNVYSKTYGLPSVNSTNFTQIFIGASSLNKTPSVPTAKELRGFQGENNLDVQMAHAISPNAKIVEFFAYSSDQYDMNKAIIAAGEYVHNNGGGEVSISFGNDSYGAFPAESPVYTATENAFINYPNVAYVVSTGDDGGFCGIPACFSNVISAGGATVTANQLTPWCNILVGTSLDNAQYFSNPTDASNYIDNNPGSYIINVSGGNGGFVANEPKLNYQTPLSTMNKYLYSSDQTTAYGVSKTTLESYRATPDISFDSNPITGVNIYDYELANTSTQNIPNGWEVIGGTSVSAPAISAMINIANVPFGGNSSYTIEILDNLYNNSYPNSNLFQPITKGAVYWYQANYNAQGEITSYTNEDYSRPAGNGYNIATGLGLPNGLGCFA